MIFFRRRDTRPSEATVARKKAERDLEEIRAETPRYRALGRMSAAVRDENNLGRHLTEAFRGNR